MHSVLFCIFMVMNRILLLVLIIGLLASCKKNELKQPTDVSFKMDINRSISPSGQLVFNSGTILLASFSVNGKRIEGDPIAFNREFSSGLLVNFDANTAIPEIDFDLPQGTYEEVKIVFESVQDQNDVSIVARGNYTNNLGVNIPVIYQLVGTKKFEIESEDNSGTGSIVLDKNVNSVALIKLDPIHWFDILTNSQLENADLTNVDGVMTMLINKDVNENLYDLIENRIDESSESIFQ